MTSLVILFLGTFWEVSMDIIGMKHNFEQSQLKRLANYFDSKHISILGNKFWDNSIAWGNKWKNNDPKEGEAFWGSSTVFVTILDGWHFVKFIWLMHLFVAILLFERISAYFILDIFMLYMAFGIGHEFFGYVIKIKPKSNQINDTRTSAIRTTIDINCPLKMNENHDKSRA